MKMRCGMVGARVAWSVLLLSAMTGGACAQQHQAAADARHVTVPPEAIKWQPMPRDWAQGPRPSVSKGPPEVAIIWGDPMKEGAPFLIRIRDPRNAVAPVPPHHHPTVEHITVLSGVFCPGMGGKFDENACQDMPAGSHMVVAKGTPHFAVAKNAVIEVYGIGPFKIEWVQQ